MRQMERLADKIGTAWCILMHDSAMWPIHGQYRCRACLREFPALGSEAMARRDDGVRGINAVAPEYVGRFS